MPEATTTPTRADGRLQAAHRFRAGVAERAAERVVALEWGSAIYHSAVPRLIDLNAVRVEASVPALTAGELGAEVDRLQQGLPLRRVEVFDEPTAGRLSPGLQAAGWQLDRSLLMAFDGPLPEPLAPAPAIEEVPYRRVEPLREEWIRSQPWAADEEMVAQALAGDRLMFSATPTRAFMAAGRSYALLLERDGIAMVEDVYTTPADRGRGLAAAVVCRLVAESRAGGAQLTFLATSAAGRAQHLYARLGFHPLGLVHRYLRMA